MSDLQTEDIIKELVDDMATWDQESILDFAQQQYRIGLEEMPDTMAWRVYERLVEKRNHENEISQ